MDDPDFPPVTEQIVRTLMRVINRISLSRRVSRDYGEGGHLTMIESEICGLIAESNRISGSELAERLGVTRSATSQSLNKLREKGLIEDSQSSATDARRREVRLTRNGREAAKVALRYARMMEIELFDESPEELEHYLRFVTKLEAYHSRVLAEMDEHVGSRKG